MRRAAPPRLLMSAATLVVCMLLPLSASAMRCGSALISKGDIQAKVLQYCGDPIQTTKRYGLRRGVYVRSGISLGSAAGSIQQGKYYYPYGQSEVLIEDWVFNLGPNKLMRQLTFENGIVVRVETLGYGYN